MNDISTDLRARVRAWLAEHPDPSDSELAGRSIKDSDIRAKYGVIVVTIKKASGEVIFNPDASVILEEGDTFVAIGEKTNLTRLLVDGQIGSKK